MSAELRLMTRAGKTFFFATLWLGQRMRQDAAIAYSFCRQVDDIADSQEANSWRDSFLTDVARMIRTGHREAPLVENVLGLIDRFPTIREPLAALVEACRDDTDSLVIRDESDLERYAHGVAGNVGLVMYPILGGTDSQGMRPAADLGIAMQYTNIARDVREDFGRGRVYLPSSWLDSVSTREELLNERGAHQTVIDAVSRLLLLARERYERGMSGVHYLAPESRYAIKVAARCYAAIGDRVIRDGRLVAERAVVPFRSKVALALSERFLRAKKVSSVA